MPFGEARGLTCPKCKVGQCRARKTGRANDQTIFLRRRYCDNPECGFAGNTFETWFEGAHIAQMDEDIKWARMMRERAEREYQGIKCGHPTSPVRFGRIHYSVLDGEGRVLVDTMRGIYNKITSTVFRRPERHDIELTERTA